MIDRRDPFGKLEMNLDDTGVHVVRVWIDVNALLFLPSRRSSAPPKQATSFSADDKKRVVFCALQLSIGRSVPKDSRIIVLERLTIDTKHFSFLATAKGGGAGSEVDRNIRRCLSFIFACLFAVLPPARLHRPLRRCSHTGTYLLSAPCEKFPIRRIPMRKDYSNVAAIRRIVIVPRFARDTR